MEEAEIDEWFNEQKERLEEKFYTDAQKDPDKAKHDFDVAYKKLISDLQHKHDALYNHTVQVARMQAPLLRLRDQANLVSMKIQQWFSLQKQAVKKWIFDQKVKRIIKDKSDLLR